MKNIFLKTANTQKILAFESWRKSPPHLIYKFHSYEGKGKYLACIETFLKSQSISNNFSSKDMLT